MDILASLAVVVVVVEPVVARIVAAEVLHGTRLRNIDVMDTLAGEDSRWCVEVAHKIVPLEDNWMTVAADNKPR